MRRFNQAWLLDPNYYQVYWGYGALSLADSSPKAAIIYFEKAIELINEPEQKHRLLVDAARSYALQGNAEKDTSQVESEKLLNKSISLIDKALKIAPQFGNAYYWGAKVYRSLGKYKKSWEMVKRARDVAGFQFDPKFLEDLSNVMPEPK